MICINENIDSIDVKLTFSDRINILLGDSGTGKTYLMSLLMCKFVNTDLSVSSFDYRLCMDRNKDGILREASGSDIILLDNADLYMTRDLFNILLKGNGTIVISMRNLYNIPLRYAGKYKVEYDNNSLNVRRVNKCI